MASDLQVSASPDAAPGKAFDELAYAHVDYEREIAIEANGGAAGITESVPASSRAPLDPQGKAAVQLDDYDGKSKVYLQIEDAQGIAVHRSSALIPGHGASGFAAHYSYPVAVLHELSIRMNAPTVATLERAGSFHRVGNAAARFEGFDLVVCPIGSRAEAAVVKSVLGIAAGAELATGNRAIAPDDPVLAKLARLAFRGADLKFDGAFRISSEIVGGEKGWAWLLLGPQLHFGFQAETRIKERWDDLTIVLAPPQKRPRAATPKAPTPGTPGALTMKSGEVSDEGCRCKSSAPLAFDERQLVEKPEAFSDDPGPYCEPFRNPQRILGERAFHTVLRVEQPEIGSQPSLRPIALPPITEISSSTRLAHFAHTRPLGESGVTSRMARIVNNVLGRGASPEIGLRPIAGSLGLAERREIVRAAHSQWRTFLRRNSKGRQRISANNAIQWEGDASVYQATTIAGGHILEWRVQWRSNGYSLGNVASSLTLTPRQTRRISSISWRRREESRRTEQTVVTEELHQMTTRERDYSDAVQASLSEWSSGGSRSATTGAAGGLGFAMGGFVIGGGAAHGRSSSSSWQSGGRQTAASEQQSLRDAIRQFGESLRQLESAVVTEVTQEEEVTGVSEVLRNPNYCHSLTVIYHEILRHLRVDTSLANVRECLFVPFSLSPFDLERAIRWREILQRGLRKPQLRWAMAHLEDVFENFANSSIPPGPRSTHPITHLTGSIYVQLAIDRPKDTTADQFDELVWARHAALFPNPIREIFGRMVTRERVGRDSYYQSEVAPGMAARWADRLELRANGVLLDGVDFTLATRYRFNQVVRIDFTYAPPAGNVLTRQSLEQLNVRAAVGLPPGSIANVTHVTIHYHTEHFDRPASSDRGVRDLVNTDTGEADNAGATAHLALSAWEREDLRARIAEAVDELLTHLNEYVEYYHKLIWWNMDRDRLYMLLDGFYVSATDTRSLASVVERDPVGILGNALVFRVAAGAFLGLDGHRSVEALLNHYKESDVPEEPLRVSLPTSGLYAQALMDSCVACEEHFGSVDWVLGDKDPEVQALAPELLQSRRTEPTELKPTAFPQSIINLQNAPEAPAPSGLAAVLDAVTKANAFRDMAGLAGTQANARAAMETAASLAESFGAKAIELGKAQHGTSTANQKLASIRRAQSDGLIDKEQANQLTNQALGQMNADTDERPLTREPTVESLIAHAGGKPDTPIEVRRGAESVSIGGTPASYTPASSGVSVLGAPGTNPGSTAAEAKTVVSAFASRTSPLSFNVLRAAVATRLNKLIADPDAVDQGSLNVCGPAAVLRTILRRDPRLCAQFTIDLVEKGEAKFGSVPVKPDSDLRNQTFQSSWGCPVAEWVACSALRDDENWLFDFEGTPEETLSAATTPGEIADWLQAAGLYSSVKDEANLVLTRGKAHALGLTNDTNTDNILFIHSHLLRSASATKKKSDEFILRAFPNHWVVLASPVAESGGRVNLDVWSWGSTYTIDVPTATFEANYYGAVIARV